MAEKLTYDKAFSRLEQVVKAMESGDGGIDSLAAQLKEAKQLTEFCQSRLAATNEDIEKILGAPAE